MREPLHDTNSKHWREKWRNYGHATQSYYPNYGTSKSSTLTGDNASRTFGMKARNVGQHSPNYT
jgi:hypothetical protein